MQDKIVSYTVRTLILLLLVLVGAQKEEKDISGELATAAVSAAEPY